MYECVNRAICHNRAMPPETRCLTCRLFGLPPVRVRPNETCAICFEADAPHVEFPAGCGHAFCASCVRDVVFCTSASSSLPSTYGGPPCPNACTEPCSCEAHADVVFAWSQRAFMDFASWENKNRQRGARGSRVCPLCRAKIKLPDNVKNILLKEILLQSKALIS